ncbi:transmembrane protease serine 13a isoform X1 [Denticeps clupeoides]|uniref:transmembrane protease serine 13a isoform X1 n=1 Tax=Denticeps clupeoides TaxID=299321 RepID=UPI0010A3BAEA|nr:transmembrane protease serine 13-like isoform X1 [Denticeps clupeoides]
MAEHDPKDAPPPYYCVSLHIRPPLHIYKEVAYTNTFGLPAYSQPHYIPQHAPVVAAPVTQHSIPVSAAPPYQHRKACCGKDAQCYGGSGVTVFLLIFLAIAIWLGVHYSSRLATTVILQSYTDSKGSTEQPQSMATPDTCSNATVLCDAHEDCLLGSDEANCVRFDSDGGLQIRTAEDGRFLPVCYQGWTKSLADQTCAQLGFRRSFDLKPLKRQQFKGAVSIVARESHSQTLIQGLVTVSSSCPSEQTVSLECIECGRQQSVTRIIGGNAAKLGQWPWQVSLHFLGVHVCGGSLLSPDFVITAAHCFQRTSSVSMEPRNWRVYGGTLSQKQLPEPFLVKKIIVNENYNKGTNDQDIALLRLTRPVDFNYAVQPVCLPAFDQSFTSGTQCWTTGFGTTEEGADQASIELMEVSVDIIDTRVCNSSQVYQGRVTKNMICAGDIEGRRDTCQGDSGGPLVCTRGYWQWYLVGVTSWGAGCGRRGRPGVYSSVPSILPWIYSTMQNSRATASSSLEPAQPINQIDKADRAGVGEC